MSRPTPPSLAEAPPAPATARCPHCGAAVEGAVDAFCCAGCEAAAAIIRGAGLERYYAERREFAPRPAPVEGAWREVPTETDTDGYARARLVVDGLRCASCVWVTENVLARTPGVVEATVSYATGRTLLRWDPAVTDLATLAGRIAALGYRPRPLAEAGAPDRDLLLRLGVAAFATLGVMGLYEPLYAGWWYGDMAPHYGALFRWASLALATPVALWCAAPFFAGAWTGLRHRVLHMDLPIALGVAVLYVHGVVTTIRGTDGYLDSLTMLVALLLGGRLLESRGRRRAAEAALALVGSVPRTVRRVRGDSLEVVPADSLVPGDRIDLGAGEECPVDGVVLEGAGQMRLALVTGEAAPVAVAPGDRVVAGALLVDGALTVAAEATGGDTLLHRMAAQLQAAADEGMRPTAADRLAPWFTAATLVLAAGTFAAWTYLRGTGPALEHAIAVLVVACPCAVALSQPLAAAAGLGATARRGLLLRSAERLLDLDGIDLVVLDKTGTVTEGALTVVSADDATLRIAAGLERYSTHPIARAIVEAAIARGIPLPRGAGVVETPGRGIAGWVDGRRWILRGGGPGEVELVDEVGRVAVIRLGDAVRPDAAATVAALRARGHRVVLLTGDHPDVASHIGRAIGADEIIARADPEAKAAWIAARRAEGRRVLFAGDGINDGPALAAADVGIAMGHGAASSVLVADGLLVAPGLSPVLAGLRTARAAAWAVRANLERSVAYNVVTVAAAAAGYVNPLVAAVLMPISSAVVIWGALRVEPLVRRAERWKR